MSVAIYKATYSSVPVYELPCQGVAVMRRKADGWLNATQILKVAGFDKPQRTRVLEREVQKGTHEKVQGGYGKYQGTWVPMDRGIALSRQYGVDRLLQPIFDYVPTADSPPLAPKHITAPPARPKKKLDGAAEDAPKVSRVAANKATAARKAAEYKRQADERREMEESEDDLPLMSDRHQVGSDGRSRSPTPSEASESSATPSPLGSEVDPAEYHQHDQGGQLGQHQQQQHQQQQQQHGGGGGGQQASKKRKYHDVASSAPASAHAQLGLGPLRYARMILDYFVSESTQVPSFLVNPPTDFDANVVIDDDGHTALHWACAMGRIRIVKLLLTAGADIFRANSMGQTALMRSVMFTNNYDLRKFPELFELLHRSTINIDRNDRTVFHYIVDIALQKGKTHAARYYIEHVLQRLVDYPKEVADILNFQDEEGETALTLAARARSKRLVKILLDNGADPKVQNRDGKSAEDYILEDERFRESELAAPGNSNALLASSSASVTGAPAGIISPSLLAPYAATHHTSTVGIRASQTCIPLVADLLESLATSFDSELSQTDLEIAHARTLVSNLASEISDGSRTLDSLRTQASAIDLLEAREQALVAELENRMGKRFRLGWEKWVRDEDSREQAYDPTTTGAAEWDLDAIRALADRPPSDAPEQSGAIRRELEVTKERRRERFREFATLQSRAGTGVKMGQYRHLIALGCGVPLDQVEGVIESLCENFEEGAEA